MPLQETFLISDMPFLILIQKVIKSTTTTTTLADVVLHMRLQQEQVEFHLDKRKVHSDHVLFQVHLLHHIRVSQI